jgi:methyl-accepting chemotaxis protein
MDDIIKVSDKNSELRNDVQDTVEILTKDAQELQAELSKFTT